MSKPHCYGKMEWINKYPEDNIPKSSICDCGYVSSCLRHTRNRLENEPLEERYNKILVELEQAKEELAVEVIEHNKVKKELDRLKTWKPFCFVGKDSCDNPTPDIACKMCHSRKVEDHVAQGKPLKILEL
jgi:hypothetical protein